MRKHLVLTVVLIASTAMLAACGSSSKGSQPVVDLTTTLAPTTTAPAAAGALTCTQLAGKLTVTPPVSPTVAVAHTLSAKATLSGCTGTPGITSGELTFVAKESDKLNCAGLVSYAKPGTATVSVKWNNGKTSTGPKLVVTYDSVSTATITGPFTGGTEFVGKTSKSTTMNNPDDGGCLSADVSLKTATLSLAPGTTYTIS